MRTSSRVVISAMVTERSTRAAVAADTGAVEQLVSLLHSKHEDAQARAVTALGILAAGSMAAQDVIRSEGGIQLMVEIVNYAHRAAGSSGSNPSSLSGGRGGGGGDGTRHHRGVVTRLLRLQRCGRLDSRIF